MLEDDIKTIEKMHGFDDETSGVGEAWSRIKTVLEELGKSPNSASAEICPACNGTGELLREPEGCFAACPRCGGSGKLRT